MITIKAGVAESKGAHFEIAELELDKPRPDEVLVRMVACGIRHALPIMIEQGSGTIVNTM